VQTRLAPGQSTDGAIFYPKQREAAGGREVGGEVAGSVFEFSDGIIKLKVYIQIDIG